MGIGTSDLIIRRAIVIQGLFVCLKHLFPGLLLTLIISIDLPCVGEGDFFRTGVLGRE